MAKNLDIKKIRIELAQELALENVNINKILTLSSKLATLDTNNVRFSIDAGIIDRLGKELVERQETALSELVKNGYDADASHVKVYFIDCEYGSGGSIIIDDDGTGMTREQLINGFMRISSADKVHNPKSEKYNRTRAGRKGIGRFATQRLGRKLELITQTKNDNKALKIVIDWNDFEQDVDLALIPSAIIEIDKIKDEGTTLIILDVREKWNDASVRRAYRYITDLLQPFPLSKTLEKSDSDPGFKTTFYSGFGETAVELIDEQKAFYDHALAEIEGYVDSQGSGFWSVTSNKVELTSKSFFPFSANENSDNDVVAFTFLRNVHFKAYYFIYEASLLPTQIRSYIQETAREYGGIRVYRNGFRVLPYGEKGDDWLGLDQSVRKRVILPAHGNINLFGFVELIDEAGAIFEETSSREGLLSNQAFDELKNFTYRVILEAVLKVAALRGKKGKTSDKRPPVDNLIEDTISAIENLASKEFQEQTDDEREDKKSSFKDNNSFQNNSAEYERILGNLKLLKTQTEDILSELSLTRILAGLGLTITQFVHEIKHYIPAIELDMAFLSSKVEGYDDVFERLFENIDGFSTYTSYYDDAVSQNVLRELHPIELRDVVNRFQRAIAPELKRSEISLKKDPIGYDLYTIPMHKSEWASILMNFYTNSRKAIKRAGHKGEILIRFGKKNTDIYLEFSDNGDGIKKENKDKIFDAFFTTSRMKGTNATAYQEVVGTGLGLKIVKDIIESYNGNIYVTEPTPGYNTTIRIELPLNTK